MLFNSKVWYQLSIGLIFFGSFIMAIGISLRFLSYSDTLYFSNKIQIISSVLTIMGCSIIIITSVLVMIAKIRNLINRKRCQEDDRPKLSRIKSNSMNRILQHQFSCSVTSPGWSYQNNVAHDDESQHNQCPMQPIQERAL